MKGCETSKRVTVYSCTIVSAQRAFIVQLLKRWSVTKVMEEFGVTISGP